MLVRGRPIRFPPRQMVACYAEQPKQQNNEREVFSHDYFQKLFDGRAKPKLNGEWDQEQQGHNNDYVLFMLIPPHCFKQRENSDAQQHSDEWNAHPNG